MPEMAACKREFSLHPIAMNSFVKFAFCLAVTFCLVQLTAARFDSLFMENVKFDLSRKCANLERDVERDCANLKHKMIKESAKLLKKATKEGSNDCVETARLQAEEELNDKSQEMMSCIAEVKETLDTDLKPEAGIREILLFRNVFKNKLNMCKKTGRQELRGIRDTFSVSGKACLA